MDAQAIFGLQLVISIMLFGLLARWELAPPTGKTFHD